jgi:hypothetical protein
LPLEKTTLEPFRGFPPTNLNKILKSDVVPVYLVFKAGNGSIRENSLEFCRLFPNNKVKWSCEEDFIPQNCTLIARRQINAIDYYCQAQWVYTSKKSWEKSFYKIFDFRLFVDFLGFFDFFASLDYFEQFGVFFEFFLTFGTFLTFFLDFLLSIQPIVSWHFAVRVTIAWWYLNFQTLQSFD